MLGQGLKGFCSQYLVTNKTNEQRAYLGFMKFLGNPYYVIAMAIYLIRGQKE